MFHRLAARPLVLTASLFLFTVTGCDADGEGTPPPTDIESGSTGASSSTSAGATTSGAGTTDGDGSSSGSSAAESGTSGTAESGTAEGSSSGGEDTDSTDSTGEAEVGYADLAGDYMDNFGGTHVLSADAWVNSYDAESVFTNTLEQIDDDVRWVAGFSTGGLEGYERIDWDIDGRGRLRYCSAAYGQASLQDAIDAAPSNRDDFDGTGCAGTFAWSILTPVR